MRVFTVALLSLAFCIACHPTGASGAEAGSGLHERYAGMLDQLRTELTAKLPQNDQAKGDTLNKFLASDALDAKFAKYVVLLEATPRGLAEFAQTVPLEAITKCVLGPPYSWHPDSSETRGLWTSRLDMVRVASLSVYLYGEDSAYAAHYKPAPCA